MSAIRAADRCTFCPPRTQTAGQGTGDGDTPIDEDTRQRNLSALNIVIHHGDISSSRPERSRARYYVEHAAQITFVPQNFFCHARDDSLQDARAYKSA